jgi:hypothetical protein
MSQLSKEEKAAITRTLGDKRSALQLAVCQLYFCPEGEQQWQYAQAWGALALVMNRGHPSKPKARARARTRARARVRPAQRR